MNLTTVVIGGGAAGLSVASELRKWGISTVLLECGDGVGERWRHRYDRLHLHTVRGHSGQPGARIPRRYGRFVARDDLVEYFERYASVRRVPIRLNTNVVRLTRSLAPTDSTGDRWLVHLDSGEVLRAYNVVIATGRAAVPSVPAWRGLATYGRQVTHSSDYRDGRAYRGKKVLVVGSGNSGAEIAVDLVESGALAVDLSIRTPPHIVRREVGPFWSAQQSGILFGWLPTRVLDWVTSIGARISVPDLREFGLPRPPIGLATRLKKEGTVPVQDVGFIRAVQTRAIVIKSAVARFTPTEVVFADSTVDTYDAVIAATGFTAGLGTLFPREPRLPQLQLLDEHGIPKAHGGRPAEPGLYFLGFSITLGGALRDISRESRKVARSIYRSL